MIWNIIDHRKRKYRWACINAVIEASSADNSCEDADQVLPEHGPPGPIYDQKKNISVSEAVKWASEETGLVTLYLYDKGAGIS